MVSKTNVSKMALWSFLFVTCYLVQSIVCPAIPKDHVDDNKIDTDGDHKKEKSKVDQELDDLGLEYGRYLQEVVAALEEDKEFAKKLENASIDHIKSGAIADELHFVDHNVRSKLDELKRIEMERLRKLTVKEKHLKDQIERESSNGGEDDADRKWRTVGGSSSDTSLDITADHIHHENPHTFEVEDLHKLILAATKDLELLDEKRREDFKEYEMKKELDWKASLTKMNETDRLAAIAEHETNIKKHKDHPRVHHPGSKAQLEQVWEEQDHMPKQEFDPKTFFALHDINADGYLDPQEVEALLSLEIKKMYDPQHNKEDDPNEMMEEFHRMREHIYKEADTNRDGLISRKEFLDMTSRAEFERGEQEGWQEIDPNKNPPYTEQELHDFQSRQQQQMLHYQQQLAAMQSQGYGYGVHPDAMYQGQHAGVPMGGHPGEPMLGPGHPAAYGMPQHPGQAYGQQPHPGQVQYQQHPGQMGGHQFYQGQPVAGQQPAIGQHQANYNQHPNQYQQPQIQGQQPQVQGQQPGQFQQQPQQGQQPGQFQQQPQQGQHPNQYQNPGQYQQPQKNQLPQVNQQQQGQQMAGQAQVKPLASIN